MKVNLATGLLDDARHYPSPNCDARPSDGDINLIVIHGISLPPGQFGGSYIDQLFANELDANEHPYFAEIQGLKVSSHLLIRRDGEIVQYVPFHQRAWHAGVSCYQGRECCNDFSIGIELEGEDETPYTDEQYDALARTLQTLFKAYPALSRNTLAGHSDIAPERKTDPGPAFDWERLNSLLEA